jgi:hypothetical protein
MSALTGWLCRWFPHKWLRRKGEATKRCRRCGKVVTVKVRA